MNETNKLLLDRIYFVHHALIRAGRELEAEPFERVFSPTAPPIGWHLWHMARFGDRLQARLTGLLEGRTEAEIWYRDNYSGTWNLKPEVLGVFAAGMGQAHEAAQSAVRRAGRGAIIDYASVALGACNAVLGRLTETEFGKTFEGILNYGFDPATGKLWEVAGAKTSVAENLVFHASHGSRHLGMMEALRGLLGVAGTISA